MNKLFAGLLTSAALVTFAAFAAEEKPAPAAAPAETAAKPAAPTKDYTILKVGSEEVKDSEVQDVWKGLFPGGASPDFSSFDENIRQNVLRGIVSERLIYSEAVKEGFDKSAEVKKRLAALEKQLVMQTYMENKAKSLVTEDQLKKLYAEKVATTKNQEEVHARHILVASEDEAKKIRDEIKKGGDFDKIAKEKSTDKASGAQGGDLGWFTKDRMVPEFAEAAFKLKKGDISDPIKTSFGWHIIKVEDRRKVEVPKYEEMKDELMAEAQGKAMQEYVEGLLKKSDIKYYGPDGKERDFPRTAPAPKK
jgi:peptidyl-prolyl cis-trans isomerase C